MSNQHQNIIMFPFMSQSHFTPFISLARRLIVHHPTLTVTIATTPINSRTLRSLLDPSDHHRIHIAALPYSPADHSLPLGVENTDSLPKSHTAQFLHSGESLRPHFAALLAATRPSPLCIITDVFLAWTVELARDIAVPHAIFTTCGAYGTAGYFSFWLNLPHTKTNSPQFHLPGFPPNFLLHRSELSPYARAADPSSPITLFFRRQIAFSAQSDIMICNTSEEIETLGMNLLKGIIGVVPVQAIGPLIYENSLRQNVEWLAGRKKGTVVYISFGTQNNIRKEEMRELAKGLEESGKDFIWAVGGGWEWIPEGFEERMGREGRGKLVKGKAEQMAILSNEATGVFVSHCGWNSVVESLSRGVAMVCWPIAAEQFYNARMVEEELGVGVGVGRGEAREVAEAIEEAMEGREIRERVEWCRRKMEEVKGVEEFGRWMFEKKREMETHLNC